MKKLHKFFIRNKGLFSKYISYICIVILFILEQYGIGLLTIFLLNVKWNR
jgi:hypothetical protein